jgi:DNA-binding MarR family transcriptional regulator
LAQNSKNFGAHLRVGRQRISTTNSNSRDTITMTLVQQRHTASGLSDLVRVLANETSAELTMNQLQMFLEVTTLEPADQGDVGRRCGMSSAGMSRNATALADAGPFVPRKGYGLIDVCCDPLDRRKRQLTLTTRGHELVAKIEQALKNAATGWSRDIQSAS